MCRCFLRLALVGALAGQSLGCDSLLDRLHPSRENARGVPPSQDGPAAPAPPATVPDSTRAAPDKPVPPANVPSDMPAPTLPIVPLGPNARTQDEDNSISVFRAVAPSTVFVTPWLIRIEQNFGPHIEQKCAPLALSFGSVSSWNFCAVSGSSDRLN